MSMSKFRKDDRSDSPLAVIVLAAGHGTRMQSEVPKVLHQVAGRPMIRHVLDTVETVSPSRIVVVIGPDMEDVESLCRAYTIVVQEERLGTAHAVLEAREALKDFEGNILVYLWRYATLNC
jgi:N-acetylglucosamine-1-phosphate uridyltransferase (contains nucleotidyltransferase and I-patch acetyltransferase domains)